MRVEFNIEELNSMRKYPDELYYRGKFELLSFPKVSIVGTRRPMNYTKKVVALLSRSLSDRGVCIVSGGAMGVDAMAHKNAKYTTAVLANGTDIRYPKVNSSLLERIEKEGLLLSQFENGFRATPWSFVVRNELVVALGEVLVVAEADEDSGSMRSVEFALEMKKEIYVFPHRIGDSNGTNRLLKDGLAKPIYDIEKFANRFGASKVEEGDELLDFCKECSSFDEVYKRFGDRVYEYELEGKIRIENLVVTIL